MVFIVTRQNGWKIFDPEQGYELLNISGSSDGMHRFELVGPEGSFPFSAISYQEQLRPDERVLAGLEGQPDPVVWKVRNWDERWKPVIRAAMLAREEAMISSAAETNDLWKGVRAFVRFGNEGSVFDV